MSSSSQNPAPSGPAPSGSATSGSATSGPAPSGSASSGSATGVLAPSGSASTSTYVLVAPIMGGLEYVSSTDQMAWTGGKHNITWTSLDASASSSPSTPSMYRAVGHKDNKAYQFRIRRSVLKTLIQDSTQHFHISFL